MIGRWNFAGNEGISVLKNPPMKAILKSALRPGIIPLIFLFISCAYFNTFYNAEEYYKKAERSRLEYRGEQLSQAAISDYKKVIEKAQHVLDEYPETKLRQRAMFLISQSHFYRGEYRLAQSMFKQLEAEFGMEVKDETSYWLALIKWKSGRPQPAINGLSLLLEGDLPKGLQARIHLATAEILLDLDLNSEAMDNLEKAAELMKDRKEKGQIFYRISNISYDTEEYDRALAAYKNVIKFSISKKQIQEAHLKQVQIYRKKGEYNRASNAIRSMVLDEDFKPIYGDLEMELVYLYRIQDRHDEARVRLESIGNDYPKTAASSEAYYLLGEYALETDWELEAALKHFNQSIKEDRRTLFSTMSQARIKEIKSYQKSFKIVADYLSKEVEEPDSLKAESIPTQDPDPNHVDKELYNLAELEAFHFGRIVEAAVYLDRLLQDFPASELVPKSLFTRVFLAKEQGQTALADSLGKILATQYPKSEYAEVVLREGQGHSETGKFIKDQLLQAESLWLTAPESALEHYKYILALDTLSIVSAKAGYFLAYQYDHTYHDADSALKYYDWVLKYHAESEQALESRKRREILTAGITKPDQADQE